MSDQKKSLEPKVPYATPVIQVYGDIRTITKGTGNKGAFDNAKAGPQTKA